MDSLFAQFDAACPESLFTFLANSEDVAGALTRFALPVAREVGTLEQLQKLPPEGVQKLAAAVGMPAASVELVLAGLSKTSDERFEGVKTFNGVPVKPLPRWTLLVGEIFEILDVDKSGTLDLGEYMALAAGGASPFSFFVADKDGNGTIDSAEFLAMHLDHPAVAQMTETELEAICLAMKTHLRTRKPMPKSQLDRPALLAQLFAAFDSDGDGEVDYMEFQQFTDNPEMEEMMAMWFSAIDSQGDGDGKIQLAEWIKTMGHLNQHMTDMQFERWLFGLIMLVNSK